jgi:2-polyprenyl-3-methyl-5-hydroxy-6-metoxy-1,4-benzoquinol methylase
MISVSQDDWNKVIQELEGEQLKLMSYDNTLMSLMPAPEAKRILDYGAGPGILASALQRLDADVHTWDINPQMSIKAGERIGQERVFQNISDVLEDSFEIVICNLVLCIATDKVVLEILKNISKILRPGGRAYFGFCNPKLFNVPESQLDYRFQTEHSYENNHSYKKIKKEGGYEIIEMHRPLSWYEHQYNLAGLKLIDTTLTPEYSYNGALLNDFVIYTLST